MTWIYRYSPRNSLIVGYVPYPYTDIVSVDNLVIEFTEPSKDVAFFWGRQGYYNTGTIQIIDINNQTIANVAFNFGYNFWTNISLNQYSQRIKKLVLRRPYVSDARYGHIYIDNFQFTPNPFVSPVGSLNSVSTTAPVGAVGWSADPDNPSASNNVDCYVDGQAGQGRFIGRVLANNLSPSGVPYSGNHGFFMPIPTDLRDGVQHQMYCYGIDIDGVSPQTLLTGSPKAFTWNLDSTVEFSNLPPLVEKYSLETLNVTVRNLPNPTNTTRLTFRTTNGTGVAKFINSSNQLADEIVITGNVVNQAVRILAITESSQANNLIVEARIGNSTTVKASHIFTIATITSLVFEKFDATYTDLDNNGQPLVVSQRIFPDKKDSADQTDRSLVKVKATISPALPNVQVYFANFDLDDPSANTAPIDTEGSAGDDNNGSVMIGATPSSAGQLSLFTTLTDCSATVGKANCVTGADGTLTVQFKTTMQPGDNFAIAASLSDSYRNDFWLYPSGGTQILNGEGNVIHISGEENFDETPGIRTQMLTVWRRLHIEVDSMGETQNNFVEGTIPQDVKIQPNQIATITVSPTPNIPLEVNRFEGGRLFVNGSSLTVVCNYQGVSFVCNTEYTVKVQNTESTSIYIPPNASFTLYDDDDMDDEDVGNLNGDEGDDVPMPDICLIQGENMPSWSNCAIQGNGDNSATNLLAPAYVRPIYDIGDNNNNVPFLANVPLDNLDYFDFDQSSTAATRDFWTIYLLGAYQNDGIDDCDPSDENGDGWIPDCSYAITETTTRLGSVIFMEVGRRREYPSDYATRFVNRATTSVHEIGHLFFGDHEDEGVMADPFVRTSGTFTPTTIGKIRDTIFP